MAGHRHARLHRYHPPADLGRRRTQSGRLRRLPRPGHRALLPTWDEALDDLDQDDDAEPPHVVRFGTQADVKGLLAGTPEADRRIGYLAKYLTKDIADCHADDRDRPTVTAHADRLVETLKYEPCSPTCANWLRYGIQPKNARPDLTPGRCRAKAHQREHLGYGGRRVLVSRKWSGKTLTDHRHDRRAFVLALLGIAPDTRAPPPTKPRPVHLGTDQPPARPDHPPVPPAPGGHRRTRPVEGHLPRRPSSTRPQQLGNRTTTHPRPCPCPSSPAHAA